MSKEKKDSKKSETEYQYSEDEFQEEEPGGQMPPEPKRNWWTRLPSKRLIIVAVAIVAIAIVYQFTNVGPKKAEQLPPQEVITNTQTQVAEVKAEETSAQGQLGLLTQQNTVDEAQIRDLQLGMQRMSASLAELQNSIANLNASVQALTNQVQQTGTVGTAKPIPPSTVSKRAVREEEEVSVPVAEVRRVYVPKPVYHLKAVIPGRAWLQTKGGKLLTVKVGDKLYGYGIVKAINANEGWVGTSSGTVIQYGPNDS